MCYMVEKLMTDLIKTARYENKLSVQERKNLIKKSSKVINLDYADNMCQKLFALRTDDRLQNRIKFRIQDLIDSYNKEWRYVIAETKSRV